MKVSLTTIHNYSHNFDCCRFSLIFDPDNCINLYVLNLCDGGSISFSVDNVQEFSILEDDK